MCPDETATNHVSWKASLNNWWRFHWRGSQGKEVLCEGWEGVTDPLPSGLWRSYCRQNSQVTMKEPDGKQSSAETPAWVILSGSEEAKAAHTTSAQYSTPGDTTSSKLLSCDAMIQSQMREGLERWLSSSACLLCFQRGPEFGSQHLHQVADKHL